MQVHVFLSFPSLSFPVLLLSFPLFPLFSFHFLFWKDCLILFVCFLSFKFFSSLFSIWWSLVKKKIPSTFSVTQSNLQSFEYSVGLSTPVSCEIISQWAAPLILQSAMAVVSLTLMWAQSLSLSVYGPLGALLSWGSMFIGYCLTNCWMENYYIAITLQNRSEASSNSSHDSWMQRILNCLELPWYYLCVYSHSEHIWCWNRHFKLANIMSSIYLGFCLF